MRATRTDLGSSQGEVTHIKPIVSTPPDAARVIEELSLLLTAGRMSDNTAAIARARFERVYAATGGDAAEAAREAQQLLLASPEFSISNEHITPIDAPTRATSPPRSGTRPFKGIVVIFLHGGADTWNLLVPRSECERHVGKDLYAEYVSTRTNLALKESELLPIEVSNGTQPCNGFGIHHEMKELRRLYSLGDAAFVANVGQMVESIANKDEFRSGRKRHPPSMFAHNFAQRSAQNVHAQMGSNAKGVLGRLLDHVTSESGGAYSPGRPTHQTSTPRASAMRRAWRLARSRRARTRSTPCRRSPGALWSTSQASSYDFPMISLGLRRVLDQWREEDPARLGYDRHHLERLRRRHLSGGPLQDG